MKTENSLRTTLGCLAINLFTRYSCAHTICIYSFMYFIKRQQGLFGTRNKNFNAEWWAEQKLMCYSYVLLFPQQNATQFRRGILLEQMPWPRQFSEVSVRIHCEQAASTALLIACFTITTSACKFHGIGFKYEIYMSNTFIPVCKYSACCCAIYFGTRASQFIPHESLCPPNWMKPKQKRWTIKWNPIWMQSGSIDLLLLSKKWMKWSE